MEKAGTPRAVGRASSTTPKIRNAPMALSSAASARSSPRIRRRSHGTYERTTCRRGARLRALPGRYHVVTDSDGWPMIPGRAGRIENSRRRHTGHLYQPSSALRQDLEHSRRATAPDRRHRDAGGLPARGPRPSRPGDRCEAEAEPVVRPGSQNQRPWQAQERLSAHAKGRLSDQGATGWGWSIGRGQIPPVIAPQPSSNAPLRSLTA
jgi:hypothetical protein